MSAKNINQVVSKPIVRFSTGIEGLDWLYGNRNETGLAFGKLSLWTAPGGIGKSRTAIEVCKSVNCQGYAVMYVTCELDPGSFIAEKLDGFISRNENFYISDSTSQQSIIDEIRLHRPRFVIIDSINVIEEYGSSKNSAKLLINGGIDKCNVRIEGLREVAEEVGTHIILIVQMNQNGTVKGGTALGHWIDTEVYFGRWDKMIKFVFEMRIEKHRYGVGGRTIIWEHHDTGVRCVDWGERVSVLEPEIVEEKSFFDKMKFWQRE